MKTGFVSIIIATCNNHLEECLKPCIESIISNTDLTKSEVIVVASGCTDGTREYVNSLGPPFKLVWYEDIVGLPTAINSGIWASEGEWIVHLDDDTVILPHPLGWISVLVEPFLRDQKVGITGPIKMTLLNRFFLVGFCMMFKREIFDKVGPYDEIFSPAAGEDADFCLKVQDAGYKLVQVPDESNLDINHGVHTMVGDFPIWHKGEKTLPFMPGITYNEIIEKNTKILVERYKKFRRKMVSDRISIIIPTYNHLKDCLKPCVESVIRFTDFTNVEVIVSANGCTDGTREYVESLGSSFKLVWNEEPSGFPKAINEGVKESEGEFIVLLNNDTEILDFNWMSLLKEPFSNPSVGITGPLRMYQQETNRLFMIFFCVMIKRELFEKIGLLDESFTVGGGEDTDFCFKAVDMGYKFVQVPYDQTCYDADMNPIDGLKFTPNFAIGWFPIYHRAEITVHESPIIREVQARNLKILVDRYGSGG